MILPTLAALCAAAVAGLPGGADDAGPGAEAPAATASPALRWIASAGYDVAVGDRLELLRGDGGTLAFRVNGGAFVAAGVGWSPLRREGFDLRATIGVKQGAAVSTGADARYRAFPLDLLATWGRRAIHVGIGASIALGASVRGTDAASDIRGTFATPIGVLAQVEWARRDPESGFGSSVGLRALWQAVRADGHGATAASAVGLFVGVSR